MVTFDKNQYKKLMVGIISAGVLSFGSFAYLASANKAEALAPCIVTISGVQYNVAPLTQPGVHPGGNIFTCGTDMTAIFMSMPTHAADLARLTPYIYQPPTSTPTNTPTSTPTNAPSPSVTATITPSPSTSPSPEVTNIPSPSATITSSPSPSVTSNPVGDDEDHDEHEKEERHHDKKRGYEKEPTNHGRTRAQMIHNEHDE
jgi:hypothetical protein